MRWWWCVVLSVVLALAACPRSARSDTVSTAPTAILIDALSGQTLHEQDADAPRRASALSQLMVLLLSLEEADLGALPLDVPVAVSQTAAAHPAVVRAAADVRRAGAAALAASANRIPLRADKVYLLSDLLKAVTVSGANDAAVAAAEAIAGSVPACLDLMNARAQRLGMSATHYAGIGGVVPEESLPDVTTAHDVARLAQAVVRHPAVLQWASLSGLPFDDGAIVLRNTNQLVGTVPGVDGLHVSSGGDAAPAYSIVATARRGALRLIAVVLDAPSSGVRYSMAAELLDWGFAHYEQLDIARAGEPLHLSIHVANGALDALTPIAGQTFSILRRRDEERDLQVRYQLPTLLAAPIQRHQEVGEVIVQEHGQLLAVIPILSPKKVVSTSILAAALH